MFIHKIQIIFSQKNPNGWRDIKRAMFDFAVLELAYPVSNHRHFMQFNWKSDPLMENIQFFGYPGESDMGIYGSKCIVEGQVGTLLLNHCDSSKGI